MLSSYKGVFWYLALVLTGPHLQFSSASPSERLKTASVADHWGAPTVKNRNIRAKTDSCTTNILALPRLGVLPWATKVGFPDVVHPVFWDIGLQLSDSAGLNSQCVLGANKHTSAMCGLNSDPCASMTSICHPSHPALHRTIKFFYSNPCKGTFLTLHPKILAQHVTCSSSIGHHVNIFDLLIKHWLSFACQLKLRQIKYCFFSLKV